MTRHRGKYTTYLNGKCTKTNSFDLFNEFGIENCKIELVENYACSSKEELLKREGFYIANNPCVNRKVSGRTFKEYYEQNKPTCLAQRREYKEKHKEKAREQHQKRFQERKHILLEKYLCGCGMHYTFQHKKRHEKCKHHQEWLMQQEQK